MAEAGYADGFRLTIHGPAGRYTNDTRILEAIAQMLSSIGIETSVETMPASVFFKRFARGGPDKKPEFTAAMSGYANGSGEPSHPLRIFIHTKQKERGYGPGNRNGYSNAEVDKMIEDGRASMDIENGEKLFIKATEIAMSEYALLPIHFVMGPLHGSIVNWCGHRYGYVNDRKTKDNSKNTLPVDILMMGELFQNNHHSRPKNIKFSKRWFEIDPGYIITNFLSKIKILRIKNA